MLRKLPGAGWVVAAVLAVAAAGMGVAAAAGTLSAGAGNSYVGCVAPKSGAVTIVSSASQCPKGDSVVMLAGAQVPQKVTVDCPGQSIQAAIDAAPVNLPLTVTITGTCTQNVTIDRNDVTLQAPIGPGPGAGITAKDSGKPVIEVGGTGITLNNLTLTGGSTGLRLDFGATVTSSTGLTITGSTGNGVGLSGADLDMFYATISNAGSSGVAASSGSVAVLNSVTITGSAHDGVFARDGSTVIIGGSNDPAAGGPSVIDGNGIGVVAQGHATVSISTTQVEKNTGVAGLVSKDGSQLTVQDGSLIEDNSAGDGVIISGGSMATFQGTNTISGNEGNGVSVHDVSVVAFGEPDTNTITGNGGDGVFCASPEAMQTAAPGTITGNAGPDQDNCPTGS